MASWQANQYEITKRLKKYIANSPYRSQTRIAQAFPLSRSAVNKWVQGENRPRYEDLFKFCELCDVPYQERVELFQIFEYQYDLGKDELETEPVSDASNEPASEPAESITIPAEDIQDSDLARIKSEIGKPSPPILPVPIPSEKIEIPVPQNIQDRKHYAIASGLIILSIITLFYVFYPSQIFPDPPIYQSLCGEIESDRIKTGSPRYVDGVGVSAFNHDDFPDALLNNNVRSLEIDETGLWIGYFGTEENANNGLSHLNGVNPNDPEKLTWTNCNHSNGTAGLDVNDIVIDSQYQIWLSSPTEAGKNKRFGVSRFDGEEWYTFTTEDNLISADTFYMTLDDEDSLWVATFLGATKFNGKIWDNPYNMMTDTIFEPNIHDIEFDTEGNVWIGHIWQGLGQLKAGSSEWVKHTVETGLSSNSIRDIMVKQATVDEPESVWFSTGGGGISVYSAGEWFIHNQETGLPGLDVPNLALDKHNRVWAATDKGTYYFDGNKWHTYHEFYTHSIAFGIDCEECPFDDDTIWTGTKHNGITHSRIPYPEHAIDIEEVCILLEKKEKKCYTPSEDPDTERITIEYDEVLTPGEVVHLEITVRPRAGYRIRKGSDALQNLARDGEDRYGAWSNIQAHEDVEAGVPYTFTTVNYDDTIIAPQLEGEEVLRFTSRWRAWMKTRFAGPELTLVFKIKS